MCFNHKEHILTASDILKWDIYISLLNQWCTLYDIFSFIVRKILKSFETGYLVLEPVSNDGFGSGSKQFGWVLVYAHSYKMTEKQKANGNFVNNSWWLLG